MMPISHELQDNIDELNKIISYGNKNGWDTDEPIQTWVDRYNGDE